MRAMGQPEHMPSMRTNKTALFLVKTDDTPPRRRLPASIGLHLYPKIFQFALVIFSYKNHYTFLNSNAFKHFLLNILEHGQHLLVQKAVGGQNGTGVKVDGPAFYVRHPAAGFAHQQGAGQDVPGIGFYIKENIKDAVRDIGSRGQAAAQHPDMQDLAKNTAQAPVRSGPWPLSWN
jgi:hypothetical protein